MLTADLINPIGAVVVELRDDAGVAALVDGRVRTFEPLGKSSSYEGDSVGPGRFKAFIVITTTSAPPHARVPVVFAEYVIRCYGATPQAAAAVWGAVVRVLHQRGGRARGNGQWVFKSKVLSGGAEERDPDTQQPYVEGVISVIATAQAIA